MEESKAKLLKHIVDEKTASLIMSRMKKQMNKDTKQYLYIYIINYITSRL